MKIQLLMTGNELMSGDIVDSNSAMIAEKLKNIGLTIKRKVTVADDIDDLINEISHISQQANLLIINGGLGPTTDDLTAQALAKAANVPLVEHKEALEHLSAWCNKKGYELTGSNLKQAILPQGCSLIANSVGSAVGFRLTLNNCDIMCTPGVPSELSVMLTDVMLPIIQQQIPKEKQAHTSRLQIFGYGESGLQNLLNEHFHNWPKALELGFRASMPFVELKITSYTTEAKTLKALWISKIKTLLGEHIVHEISDKPLTMANCLLALLHKKNKTLTTAESCTGGLIASLLTQEAGASASFHAGFVTYANEIKQRILNVPSNILEQFGAVSEEVVTAMAEGALQKSSADLVIAVSGIAGPDGGSNEKPVGTVWIAWGEKGDINTVCLNIKTSRWYFQLMVANICLDLIRRKLINTQQTPRYFIERKAN